MTAELICVGTELLLGNILNTNAQFISKELADLGINVMRQSVIGDNPSRLEEWVNDAKSRCDLLVFTGGLGPTADDLTKETVARCYGDTLCFDEEEWEKITNFFNKIQRPLTENNRKQAMVPTIGDKIINNWGTAPGAWFKQGEQYAVLMPGVPREMKAMWQEGVKPRLLAMQNATLTSITLRVVGGESWLEAAVTDLLQNENPTAAIYCKTGECEIRITAKAATTQQGEKDCYAYAEKFYEILGDAIYDVDVNGIENTLVNLLNKKSETVTTAESCTGGMVAQRITSVSGSSSVFETGFVSYAESSKAKLLGVNKDVMQKYHVVSAPVAAQMAVGALKKSGANYAVSVTGIAGPTGGDEKRPVGRVFLAVADDKNVWIARTTTGNADRHVVRVRASQTALELVLRKVQGKDVSALSFSPVAVLPIENIYKDDVLSDLDVFWNKS